MSDIRIIKDPHPNAQPPVERKEIQVDSSLSRNNPSERYKNLVEEYKTMHSSANGMFNGRSLVKFTDIIHSFIEKNKCKIHFYSSYYFSLK